MRLFLSWSQPRSHAAASAFSEWIRQTVQAVEPWFSSEIGKGKRWSHEVTDALRSSPMGVIFVTPENLAEPWLLFETGAISNTKDAQVCTFLIGLKESDVPQPLGQFQHTLPTEADVRKLVGTINDCVRLSGGRALDPEVLDKVFRKNWPHLEAELCAAIETPAPATVPTRDVRDLLDEALQILRSLDRRTSDLSTDQLVGGRPSSAAAFARRGISQLAPLERAFFAQSVAHSGASSEFPEAGFIQPAHENDTALPLRNPGGAPA